MRYQWILLAACVAGLTACGGGGGDGGDRVSDTPATGPKAECLNQLATAGSSVISGCTNCQGGINASKANDGNRSSYAAITLYVTSSDSGGIDVVTAHGVAYLRAEARDGLSFPAGQPVGAIVQLAGGVLPPVQTVTISTLLAGVVQESFNADPREVMEAAGEDHRFAYPSTRAYDAVQFTVGVEQPASLDGRPQIRIYEFCG